MSHKEPFRMERIGGFHECPPKIFPVLYDKIFFEVIYELSSFYF